MDKVQFENQMKTLLLNNGFNLINNSFIKKKIIKLRPDTMIINGQQINTSPKLIEISLCIEDFGDGYLSNIDGSCRRNFTSYMIQIKTEKEINQTFQEIIYWDDIKWMEKILIHLNI